MPAGLHSDERELLDRWWRAANYLTVGQIYLQANPLLHEPLRPEHIKPRLLGHWGTSPGLNLIYAHLNRAIRARDLDMIYLTGPGHGGPAIVANVFLEGSYGEIYPDVSNDIAGLTRLFRQFSTPGGIPSHVSVPIPGSIHEGGELGYSLMHAVGAVLDNPDLIAACVIGDGEAETGPLATSWQSIEFLNPARDGAVLPILHLNGYKIGGPTVLGRRGNDTVAALLHAHGYEPHVVAGDDPAIVHEELAATVDTCLDSIRQFQHEARAGRATPGEVPRWPAIILATPKGWTGPKVVDGVKVEGTFRAHQVPLAGVRQNPDHLRQLETWMRSYRPEELFDADGRVAPDLAALAPLGERRMGANPHANGGRNPAALKIPAWEDYAISVEAPGTERHESTRQLGELLRDIYRDNDTFRLFCPDETNSNRLGAVFEVTDRCLMAPTLATDDHVSADGRVMEVLSEHLCHGWLEGYNLTGRHGLFATYEAFAMVSASMTVQHTKWLEGSRALAWREPIPSLNILLTSTCWRNDHNGFSHQGPGLIDTVITKRGSVSRVYFPPDANCLLSVADHCLRSRDYVNLIVIDKQPQFQYLSATDASEHCAAGIGTWEWAGNEPDSADAGADAQPDVILACIGDIPTQETLAAADLLRTHVPGLRYRFVNVVDLMRLSTADAHPHGMSAREFAEHFTEDTDVVMAFHGYPGAVHGVLHGHVDTDRFHVHGYREQGTTTTPFDMVVLNQMSRYHLAADAVRRSRRRVEGSDALLEHCESMLAKHHDYIRVHLEDLPEIDNWAWRG